MGAVTVLPGLPAIDAGTLLLVFVRVGAMLAVLPVLGHRSQPVTHRAGLAFALTLVLGPVAPPAQLGGELLALAAAVAAEAVTGLCVGFVASLVLAVVRVAGELIGFEMGLGIAASYDPAMAMQAGPLTRLLDTLALLIFLVANGHHVALRVVAATLDRVPPGTLLSVSATSAGVASLTAKVLRAGLELATPLVAVLFAANIALALLARVAPQMNVFAVGTPLTLGIGLLGFAQSLPRLIAELVRLVAGMGQDMGAVLGGALRG